MTSPNSDWKSTSLNIQSLIGQNPNHKDSIADYIELYCHINIYSETQVYSKKCAVFLVLVQNTSLNSSTAFLKQSKERHSIYMLPILQNVIED